MRICFITSEYATRHPMGGIATYIRNTARKLVELGHDVSVICVYPGAERANENDEGVKVLFRPPRRIKVRRVLRLLSFLPGLTQAGDLADAMWLLEVSWAGWQEIRRQCRRVPFDIIEVADWGAIGFWGLLFRPVHGKILLRGHGHLKTIIRASGQPWRSGQKTHHWLERFCAEHADFIWV